MQPPFHSMRRLIDGQLTEKQWQKMVEGQLDFFDWLWFHVPPNVIICPNCHWKIFRGIRKGFPDIVAFKNGFKPLWIELKEERGRLRPEQTAMGELLLACGQRWIWARPRDRERVLSLIANPEAA